MKKIIIITAVFLKVNLLIGQEIKLNLKPNLTAQDTYSIQLFKISRESEPCSDQKAGSIIHGTTFSTCFKLIKKLNTGDSKKVINLLRKKETYGFLKYDCFSTDYAILVFDKNSTVIGYVNFSFICSNMYSKPTINEQRMLSPKDMTLVGLSNKGRKGLLRAFGLSL